jgi:hypothetical protein
MCRANLSPAQRRALLGIPVHREFVPKHTGFQWPTLAKLKQLRLINGVLGGFAGKGKWARHVITPSGLKLRAELTAQAGEAGTAETTQIGSVHEHAVPLQAECAQDTAQGQSHITKEGV